MSQSSAAWRVLRHQQGEVVLARARWCASYWCKFRGLMLRASLPPDEGLLFVYRRESVIDTSIHMFFMRFAIAAIWLDAQGIVVDKKLAKPWRPAYAPQKPAQYIVEANPDVLARVQIGDQLTFDEAAE
ncbi:MAG: DUF192 domain-containing protein [Anaerolineae bacterium]|nr:DUF192 domain-containing protein [Anaerolineae bacterium]